MALFVRVNPLDGWAGAEELRAVVRPGLAGIVLPKVRSAQDVKLADRLLGWCEQEQGLPPGGSPCVPLLETARGLREAYDIARAAARIAYLGALTAPGGDVERAVGYRWSPEGTETRVTALPRPAGRQGSRSAVPGQRTVDAHHRPAGAARLRRTEPLPRLRGHDGDPPLPCPRDQRGVLPRPRRTRPLRRADRGGRGGTAAGDGRGGIPRARWSTRPWPPRHALSSNDTERWFASNAVVSASP